MHASKLAMLFKIAGSYLVNQSRLQIFTSYFWASKSKTKNAQRGAKNTLQARTARVKLLAIVIVRYASLL